MVDPSGTGEVCRRSAASSNADALYTEVTFKEQKDINYSRQAPQLRR
jgi:hypothetical protein